MNSNREKNQAVFHKAKRELSNRYPSGRFVALSSLTASLGLIDQMTSANVSSTLRK